MTDNPTFKELIGLAMNGIPWDVAVGFTRRERYAAIKIINKFNNPKS